MCARLRGAEQEAGAAGERQPRRVDHVVERMDGHTQRQQAHTTVTRQVSVRGSLRVSVVSAAALLTHVLNPIHSVYCCRRG